MPAPRALFLAAAVAATLLPSIPASAAWPSTATTPIGRLQDFSDLVDHMTGAVTGSSLSVWYRTMTVSTGVLLPGQARQLGDPLCETIALIDPSFHADGWRVVVDGASGVALYRCFV